MKQKIISFFSTCEKDLINLNNYLYMNPEDSYHEDKSCKYILSLLQKYDFNIETDLCDLSHSFIAKKGSGFPNICFLCEYDAVPNNGHLTGHNLLTTTSIGAALSLSHIINEIGGTVTIIGCPGEYLGGTKSVMVKQGVFDDIDAVLVSHPDVTTSESGSSSAIIPLSIKFSGNSTLSFLNKESFCSLDAILLTFTMINSLSKGFPKDVDINYILSKGGFSPVLIPIDSEAKFYIRSADYKLAQLVENKLREITQYVSNLTNISYSISLYEPPSEELISNKTLNRLYNHNLKENGIIHINGARNINAGLSLGSVSHRVPCIHTYYSIINDENIEYGTKQFCDSTQTSYAFDQCKKSSLALAFTGYDLISNNTLLSDIKKEFLEQQK